VDVPDVDTGIDRLAHPPDSLIGRWRSSRRTVGELFGSLERLLGLALGLAQPFLRTLLLDLGFGGLLVAHARSVPAGEEAKTAAAPDPMLGRCLSKQT
jgi:hypothetical protein